MKYVEFAGFEDLDEEESQLEEGYDVDERQSDTLINGHGVRLPDPNADKANAERGKSLEALLALKNKRIQEELTKLRVSIRTD
jgi:homeobox protein cut-like